MGGEVGTCTQTSLLALFMYLASTCNCFILTLLKYVKDVLVSKIKFN